MMFELTGNIIICDPKYLKKDENNTATVVNTGIGCCYLTIHPVEEYKEYFAGKEAFVKDKLNKAYNGYIPRGLGKVGSDTGKIGFFQESQVDKSSLVNGEYFRIKDFTGRINTFYDSYGMLHFYGTGNYNFYSL